MTYKKISNMLICLLMILFLFQETVLIKQSYFVILSLILMGSITVINIINNKNKLQKNFLIKNFLVILFFILHFLIIVFFKPSVMNLSVLFNEFFYLFIIYLLVSPEKEEYKKILKISIICNLFINFLSIMIGYLSFFKIIEFNHTIFINSNELIGIYSNPNAMGITTCICTMLYFSYFFNKKDFKSYLILAFNILIIYFSGCRTAVLIIPFYIIFYMIIKIFPKLIQTLIILCSCGLFAILGIYYGIIYTNKDQPYLNKYEMKMNNILTNRYMLSKYSIISMEDEKFIGIDSSQIANKRFKKIPKTITREMDYSEINLVSSNNNIHNSYTQIMVTQGIIILVLFLLIITNGLKKTNKKNIPVILAILIISFFESELLISKSFLMMLLVLMLGDQKKEKYEPNCNTILYINYVDLENESSGSTVRPKKVYEALKNSKYEIKMLTGTILKSQKKVRIKRINEITKWLKTHKPVCCYIESPGEPIIYKKDRDLIRLLHYYNIPTSYFYRDCYYLFPKLYVFENKKVSIKSIIKYLKELIEYIRDVFLINYNIDIVYFPSLYMSRYFIFDNVDALPPGCDINIESEGKEGLIYVGALSENYGTDILLNALKIINDKEKIPLTLICRDNEYCNYKDKWEKNSWLKVYHVSGKEKLKEYYKDAKIAILPKRKNKYNDFAVSVKFYEYLGYGLPVIATSSKETDRIIKENKIGLISIETPEDLAQKIIELYNNEELYKMTRNNVINYAKQNTWDDRIKKIISDFERGEYYKNN